MDDRLPLALARLHRDTEVGAATRVHVGVEWDSSSLGAVFEGAGFSLDAIDGADALATRLRTLPDTVGPGMRVLLVGLNPSVYSADRGTPFARPGNRFWPAALAAGLVTRDRDAFHALESHGVGLTDLVKRATAGAGELSADEYRAGGARVESLVAWLAPAVVCFVGLSGYRIVVERTATTGWQNRRFADRPVYLMPNPSGINAHATPATLTEHLRAVRAGRTGRAS